METIVAGRSETDDRLSKAGALVEYLRANPREGRRDSEDLAAQFGLPTAIVDQLLSSQLLGTPREKRQKEWGWRFSFRKFSALCRSAVDVTAVRPYHASALTCVALLILILIEQHFGLSLGWQGASWCVWVIVQSVLIARVPRFRYAIVGVVGAYVVSFAEMAAHPSHYHNSFERLFVYGLYALVSGGTGILFASFAAFVIFVASLIDVRQKRRVQASLSRHELLGRMFELQERLRQIPSRSSQPQSPFWLSLRRRPFYWAASSSLAIVLASNLLDHQMMADVANVTVVLVCVSLSLTLTALSIAITIVLAVAVNTSRRATSLVIGFMVGGILGKCLGFAIHPPGESFLDWMSFLSFVGFGFLYEAGLVAGVRFAVFLQRELSPARAAAIDEGTVLAELLDIRSRLMAHSVSVCVLVVDVVGSTRMKEGADPLDAEYTFRNYQAWIAETVRRHGGRVDATAGDAAIAAFSDAEAARSTAEALQLDLHSLNSKFNRLSIPFRLRIALHLGEVMADLDKVQFTHVIDVAAHVEKASPIGGMAITEQVWKALGEPEDFACLGTEIDGFQIYASTPSTPADS